MAPLRERHGARDGWLISRSSRSELRLVGENLLLVLDDRLLVPDDDHLVREHEQEALLISQDLLLVGDYRPIAGQKLMLILDRRVRHAGGLGVRRLDRPTRSARTAF